MNGLISSTREILEAATYTTWPLPLDSRQGLGFEDANILGMVFEFETTSLLIDEWHRVEESMLSRFGASFRQAGEKAWNVYCILLTTDVADATQGRAIRAIEEDLHQTRKLAAHSVFGQEQIRNALLPILPLRAKPELSATDASKRLATRIEQLAPGVSDLIMDEVSTPGEILRQLGPRV